MKFRTPWYIRLPLLIAALNGIPLYLYGNTYVFFGGIEKMRRRREKDYSQVRFKKEEDVNVQTPESESFYKDLKEGIFPMPLYSAFPTDEEIEQHGLYIIGKHSKNQE